MYCFCATGFKHRVRCRGQLAKRRQSSGLSIAAIFGRSMQARSSEDALRRGKQKRRRRCLQPTELMTLLAPVAASCSYHHHGQGAWARSTNFVTGKRLAHEPHPSGSLRGSDSYESTTPGDNTRSIWNSHRHSGEIQKSTFFSARHFISVYQFIFL